MMNPANMIVRQADLSEIIDLRHAVLRGGLPREEAIFAGDELSTSRHYGAFAEETVPNKAVGCATLHLNGWENQPAWQLRGMATAPEFRTVGLGRLLLNRAENEILNEPAAPRVLWCNARHRRFGFMKKWGGAWYPRNFKFLLPDHT